MFLTCENCQTMWRLDEKHLAFGGRVVRCTACGHTWFERQVKVKGLTPDPDDISFQDILTGEMAEPLSPVDDGAARAVAPIETGHEMPPLDYRPGGLSANAFGALGFLLLVSVTLCGLFLLKGPVVRHMPAMVAFYEGLGATLTAPGEGLSLSALSAQVAAGQIDIKGKVTNGAKRDIAYPGFHVTVRGKDGAFLRDWRIVASGGQMTPGETVPLELNFKDVPEGASSVELKLTEG